MFGIEIVRVRSSGLSAYYLLIQKPPEGQRLIREPLNSWWGSTADVDYWIGGVE